MIDFEHKHRCSHSCDPDCSTAQTELPKIAPNHAYNSDKGKDVLSDKKDILSVSAAGRGRLSKKRLLDLEKGLSDLDWDILTAIRRFRVMLGKQIGRLYFYKSKSTHSSTVLANRRLKALTESGLIAAMNQKVNCREKGYVSYIYYLTEAGERIMQLHLNEPETRRRIFEPSTATLAHTLAIAECYVQTLELCRADDMKAVEILPEPECWKLYQNSKSRILKPDLAMVTEKQNWTSHEEEWYELRWFIEVDLNTENIQTIMEKCRRYYDYYQSDTEQRLHDDVFPLVVWIVKTEGRRRSLIKHIRETFSQYPRIFAVILPEEFPKLLRDELEMEGFLCPL